jgi:hypothetical protein
VVDCAQAATLPKSRQSPSAGRETFARNREILEIDTAAALGSELERMEYPLDACGMHSLQADRTCELAEIDCHWITLERGLRFFIEP